MKDECGRAIPLLQFTDYVAMFDPDNPKPLTDPQMQFRNANYCIDGGVQAIRKVTVRKTVFAVYDKGEKGEVVGGSCKITPFTIGANAHGKTTACTVGPVPQDRKRVRPEDWEVDSDGEVVSEYETDSDSDGGGVVSEYEIDSDSDGSGVVSEYEIDSDSD